MILYLKEWIFCYEDTGSWAKSVFPKELSQWTGRELGKQDVWWRGSISNMPMYFKLLEEDTKETFLICNKTNKREHMHAVVKNFC